jgi:hypothetical protein
MSNVARKKKNRRRRATHRVDTPVGDPGGALESEPSHLPFPYRGQDQDESLRLVFRLAPSEGLPEANQDTLKQFQHYLANRLILPMRAWLLAEDDGTFEETPVTVTGLLDPDEWEGEAGLLCEVLAEDGSSFVPVADIMVCADGPNRRLIEAYQTWLDLQHSDAAWRGTEREKQDPANPPTSWREALRQLLGVSLLGALYGMVLGAGIFTSEGAMAGLRGGAILLGVIGGFLGTYAGPPWQEALPMRNGGWTGALIGTLAGIVIGALLGLMTSVWPGAYVGALLGIIAGICFVRPINRPVVQIFVMTIGAAIGVVTQFCWHDGVGAWVTIGTGAGVGALAGPLVYLSFGLILALSNGNHSVLESPQPLSQQKLQEAGAYEKG